MPLATGKELKIVYLQIREPQIQCVEDLLVNGETLS